jgi:hypothetical protein
MKTEVECFDLIDRIGNEFDIDTSIFLMQAGRHCHERCFAAAACDAAACDAILTRTARPAACSAAACNAMHLVLLPLMHIPLLPQNRKSASGRAQRQLNELGGVKPLAFGQYGELGPGFD